MGYTNFTIQKIETILKEFNSTSILDLGAQNNYAQPILPAPFMSEWYNKKGIIYVSIDLCGENKSLPIDLSYPIREDIGTFDLVVDAGTSEHCGRSGKFDAEGFYNTIKNKHDHLNVGGIMYSENPKTGNWPGHSFQYYTLDFYSELCEKSGYKILELGEHAACGNEIDGWNIFCIMQKESDNFISFEDFKTLNFKLK